MTFAQRRNRLTTHFSERIPVLQQRMTVLFWYSAKFSYWRPLQLPQNDTVTTAAEIKNFA